MQVTKRDGRIMEFNKDRIVNAVVKAMMQTSEGVDIDLANKIAVSIEKQLENRDQSSVYEIQDLVEKKLMGSSRKEVATAYITYRYNRDIARKSKTRDVFLDIISSKSNYNYKKDIDNVPKTPKVTMSNFAREVSKPYVDSFLLTKEARNAQKDGFISVCNEDYYLAKSLNCFWIPLFEDEKSELESIETATNFYYIKIKELKNELDGNISIPAIDYYLAPYVRKTFIQELKKIGEDLEINIENLELHEIDDYILKDINNLKGNNRIITIAVNRAINRTKLAIKTFMYNLISLQKEESNKFISINYGTDTSSEGRCIIRELINVISNISEKYIPIQVWKKKKGINYLAQDKNVDLYKFIIDSKIPISVINLDANFNKNNKWKESDTNRYKHECAMAGNQRIFENVDGILSSINLNLPKIAIESVNSIEGNLLNENFDNISDKYKNKIQKVFLNELEKYTNISLFQLIERYKFQASAFKEQFPTLMSGEWEDSDKLNVR